MRYLFTSLLMPALLLAEVANMSGTWALNEKRSRFGDNPRPANVTLNVEHSEPKLKYTGRVNHPDEGHIIDFNFDGAIDGKEYVIKEDRGDRRVTFRRLNDRTVESRSAWSNGELRTIVTMSRDGRSMERRMMFKDRAGKRRNWVEVYDRKQ